MPTPQIEIDHLQLNLVRVPVNGCVVRVTEAQARRLAPESSWLPPLQLAETRIGV